MLAAAQRPGNSSEYANAVKTEVGEKFYKNYVNIIEAKNNDGIKCKLKASYSEEFVEKLMNIYFPKESLIYDPFMGIGTTARACSKNGRNYLGSELDKEHYDIAISLL
jgi:site-specific DNA-methyltransferase (adenine-specific)